MSIEALVWFIFVGVCIFGIFVGAFFWLLGIINSDKRDLRSEMREEVKGLRTDNARLREENIRLRKEIREENRKLRSELLAKNRAGKRRTVLRARERT